MLPSISYSYSYNSVRFMPPSRWFALPLLYNVHGHSPLKCSDPTNSSTSPFHIHHLTPPQPSIPRAPSLFRRLVQAIIFPSLIHTSFPIHPPIPTQRLLTPHLLQMPQHRQIRIHEPIHTVTHTGLLIAIQLPATARQPAPLGRHALFEAAARELVDFYIIARSVSVDV